jgi:hypothetical protein
VCPSKEALSILKDQRELLKTLVDDKNATEKKFQVVLKTLKCISYPQESSKESSRDAPFAAGTASIFKNSIPQANLITTARGGDDARNKTPKRSSDCTRSFPFGLSHRMEEMEHHCALTKSLLGEISAVQYRIDYGLRDRMHRGVLGLHWEEWSPLRKIYGDEALMKAFSADFELVGSTSRRS